MTKNTAARREPRAGRREPVGRTRIANCPDLCASGGKPLLWLLEGLGTLFAEASCCSVGGVRLPEDRHRPPLPSKPGPLHCRRELSTERLFGQVSSSAIIRPAARTAAAGGIHAGVTKPGAAPSALRCTRHRARSTRTNTASAAGGAGEHQELLDEASTAATTMPPASACRLQRRLVCESSRGRTTRKLRVRRRRRRTAGPASRSAPACHCRRQESRRWQTEHAVGEVRRAMAGRNRYR